VIFFLILRNVARSKKNSALIVLLITSITFFFFIGNSVMSRADGGLREAYIESLTGEVVIEAAGEVTMNLFGANTPVIEDYFTIPPLPVYEAALAAAKGEAGVARITSQVSTRAVVDIEGRREAALVCGVEAESYFAAFPGIELLEGGFPAPGEYGALITDSRARRIGEQTGRRPAVGTPLLFTAGGEAGFKIREAPLKGIYRYRNAGQFMDEIVITDPQTARVLASIQVASSAAGEEGGFPDTDIDGLFGDAGMGAPFEDTGDDEDGAFTPESLAGFLRGFAGAPGGGDPQGPEAGGDWNFIILRLESGARAGEVIGSLNRKLAPLGCVAVNWRVAAGNSAILLLIVQTLFNGGIFLVSVAGVIAAVNILLISVFKRTGELGTLRAIGAGDGYIRALVLGENLLLAGIAGLLSVLLGACCVFAVNRAGIVIPNELIATLLGGPVLSLAFLPPVAFRSACLSLFLVLAASVYPVEAAVRIDPIVAVTRG
jgi:ABC-type lipoprotein release transport system permease subunit